MAVENSEGFIKLLFDPGTREILGAHAIGVEATELIHEILLAKSSELLPEDIADMIHAHPTLSEESWRLPEQPEDVLFMYDIVLRKGELVMILLEENDRSPLFLYIQ